MVHEWFYGQKDFEVTAIRGKNLSNYGNGHGFFFFAMNLADEGKLAKRIPVQQSCELHATIESFQKYPKLSLPWLHHGLSTE
jgi:hypothetical protein